MCQGFQALWTQQEKKKKKPILLYFTDFIRLIFYLLSYGVVKLTVFISFAQLLSETALRTIMSSKLLNGIKTFHSLSKFSFVVLYIVDKYTLEYLAPPPPHGFCNVTSNFPFTFQSVLLNLLNRLFFLCSPSIAEAAYDSVFSSFLSMNAS